ncbi:hypothetical protein [Burkholderia sp. Ac-20353]|uniref:hypothetical protein n=1 Tax=Burkholderia sp. Ac-20353 TaxID=2703894 RepID=UPI00197B8552|nr:hypothetical protein [Burkholderia sp. Ac-20353]MBN3790834.1 hypothetical protein [Burkholderia sp. Ac-20353]
MREQIVPDHGAALVHHGGDSGGFAQCLGMPASVLFDSSPQRMPGIAIRHAKEVACRTSIVFVAPIAGATNVSCRCARNRNRDASRVVDDGYANVMAGTYRGMPGSCPARGWRNVAAAGRIAEGCRAVRLKCHSLLPGVPCT